MTVSTQANSVFFIRQGTIYRLVKYIFTWTEKKQQLILQFQMGSGRAFIYQWF